MPGKVFQRTCRMCGAKGPPEDMTKVRARRMRLLSAWYPDRLRSPDDWVHRRCVSDLGLPPSQPAAWPLHDLIAPRVLALVEAIVRRHGAVLGRNQLTDLAMVELRRDLALGDDDRALRTVVSHWITAQVVE